MKVRFIRSWKSYTPGQVIEPGDGAANELLRRGLVEVAESKPNKNESKRK